MTKDHSFLRTGQQIPVGERAGEFPPQIAREVIIHEVRVQSVECVSAMNFAVCVVNRGIEGGGRYERAEAGDWIGEIQPLRKVFGCFEILGGQFEIEFQRMAEFGAGARHFRDFARERFHRIVFLRIGELPGWEGKDVIEGNGSEAAPRFACACADADLHGDQRGSIHQSAGETDGRAINEIFEGEGDIYDADVGGVFGGDACATERADGNATARGFQEFAARDHGVEFIGDARLGE